MSSVFDLRKQLAFYGSYHANPVNVAIHIVGVPTLFWSALVLATLIPSPSFLPAIRHVFTKHLIFDLNTPTLIAAAYLIYYFSLESVAAALFVPQMLLTLLSATAYSFRPNGIRNAFFIHVLAWIAQFLGHGIVEGRAPALKDNIVGALFNAPLFVHLEILFKLGYRPELHKQLRNDIGKEIVRIRREEAEKRRAAEQKGDQ